ncbi:hypothetical protein SAMN02745911_1668 [Aureimonas altamirensis DSM 21988]|uniref:YlxR domain-containing protein n=1 Tax=Aureimonas altamirensis DSM 21988 TaxID=1121026 RepID=A0ABY1IFI5_9HYPH|nr:hypothetical protein SAMN02745911_1668 [Aureimonas altamirensis DSM 21988]
MEEEVQLNDRMCILSRATMHPDALVRLVAAPDGTVVPDLRRRLPGRGAHVEARRKVVEEVVRKGLLKRALRQDVKAGPELADTVDAALSRSALGSLGMARKAGQVVTGATKVEAAIRGGKAVALLHALDGAPDGIRKLDGAAKAATAGGLKPVPVFGSFSSDEMGLALGGDNVIHAAVLAGSAGTACLKRLRALANFREQSSEESVLPERDAARGDTVSNEHAGQPGYLCGTDDRRGTTPTQEAEA